MPKSRIAKDSSELGGQNQLDAVNRNGWPDEVFLDAPKRQPKPLLSRGTAQIPRNSRGRQEKSRCRTQASSSYASPSGRATRAEACRRTPWTSSMSAKGMK